MLKSYTEQGKLLSNKQNYIGPNLLVQSHSDTLQLRMTFPPIYFNQDLLQLMYASNNNRSIFDSGK